MKTLAFLATVVLLAVGCGEEQGKQPIPSCGEAPPGKQPIACFGDKLLALLTSGLDISAVGHDQRTCQAGEDADFCGNRWLHFSDGTRLAINSAGQYNHTIEEGVFSNLTVTQLDPRAAAHSSACLLTGVQQAYAAGARVEYFDRLFTATTVFLGFDDSESASLELADGSCTISRNRRP